MIIFPGSFNPIHEGHIEIYSYMHDPFEPVFLELCSVHPVKGIISKDDLNSRINNIRTAGIDNIIISKFSLFTDKIFNYPEGTGFIVGVDTWNRIWDKSFETHETISGIIKMHRPFFHIFPRNEESPLRIKMNNFDSDEYCKYLNHFKGNFSHLSSTKLRNNNVA